MYNSLICLIMKLEFTNAFFWSNWNPWHFKELNIAVLLKQQNQQPRFWTWSYIVGMWLQRCFRLYRLIRTNRWPSCSLTLSLTLSTPSLALPSLSLSISSLSFFSLSHTHAQSCSAQPHTHTHTQPHIHTHTHPTTHKHTHTHTHTSYSSHIDQRLSCKCRKGAHR